MKILFVTRTYPPAVGGLETASYEVGEALRRRGGDVTLIKYGGRKILLPLAYPWLMLRALMKGAVSHHDVVYLPDGVMAPMGRVLRALLRIPVVLNLNGKELTYRNSIYLKTVAPSIGKMDQLTAISTPTAALAAQKYPRRPLEKVILGSKDDYYDARDSRAIRSELGERLGFDVMDKKLLYTSGRLIRRKGVLWFIEKVLPEVIKRHPEVIYLVVGKGPDQDSIEAKIREHHLEDYVRLLGYVSDELRNLLYNAADCFVMPNIPVENDMEGLGLVAMEATSCGTIVIGSDLEGIHDAVIEGRTGYLLPTMDAAAYIKQIDIELRGRTISRDIVRSNSLTAYSWDKTADNYLNIFERAIKASSKWSGMT